VRIRATELKPRVSASSTRDHRLRNVDAHDDALRLAAWAAPHPGPVATSRTRVSTPTEAATRSGSTTRRVIPPKNRSYAAAFSSHPAVSTASKA
jgi:hypothetical protein